MSHHDRLAQLLEQTEEAELTIATAGVAHEVKEEADCCLDALTRLRELCKGLDNAKEYEVELERLAELQVRMLERLDRFWRAWER